MKINLRPRHAAGFSLMELLVVVALIIILAGLTIGGISLVTQRAAQKKATVQVKLLEAALQDYNSDNRKFPQNDDPSGDRGGEVLFKALYQDGVDAKTAGSTNAKIYLADLDPNTNKEGKGGQQWVRSSGGGANSTIVDPWGNPYLYRTGKNAQNPDFDLWSRGKDGKTSSDPKGKDSRDDIKNF